MRDLLRSRSVVCNAVEAEQALVRGAGASAWIERRHHFKSDRYPDRK